MGLLQPIRASEASIGLLNFGPFCETNLGL